MNNGKFLTIVGGLVKQVMAIAASAGSADASKVVMTDANGKLDQSLMPTGIGADTKSIVAAEALAAGDLVNIFNDAGVAKVRKADATVEGKEAHGFVLAAAAAAANATVYFEGTISGLTGLTPGKRWLATTAGTSASAAPTASGNVVQLVGTAVSATELSFEAQSPVTLA